MMSWSPWTARAGGEIDSVEGVAIKNGRGRKKIDVRKGFSFSKTTSTRRCECVWTYILPR